MVIYLRLKLGVLGISTLYIASNEVVFRPSLMVIIKRPYHLTQPPLHNAAQVWAAPFGMAYLAKQARLPSQLIVTGAWLNANYLMKYWRTRSFELYS